MNIITALAYPFLQKKKLTAVPVSGLEKGSETGCWQATDHNPQFRLEGVHPKLLSGWVSIHIHITSEHKLAPKLYLDFGEGYLESLTVYMQPSPDENSYVAQMVLAKPLWGLRFDPAEAPCRFTLSSIQLSVHSELAHLSGQLLSLMARDYRELKDPFAIVRKSYARYRKHGWTGMVERLEKEYTNTVTTKTILKKSFVSQHNNQEIDIQSRAKVFQQFSKAADGYMLFITHELGGGTQVAVEMLTEALAKEGVATLCLRNTNGVYILENSLKNGLIRYGNHESAELLDALKDLHVWHIHYHHIIDFSWDILQFPKVLKASYDYTFHDYLAICPRVNLANHKYIYCEEKGENDCRECLLAYGVPPAVKDKLEMVHSDIMHWREKMYDFLQEARKVYVPDKDVYERVKRYFVLPNLMLRPHPELEKKVTIQLKPQKVLTVAVLGAISYIKGFGQLKECVEYAYKNDLPLRFVVIGTTVRDEALSIYPNVTITGKYNRRDLGAIIEHYQCSVALFLHVWPETFSYTFSEALEHRLYPVSYDIGAISNRIRVLKCGKLLPFGCTPEIITEALMEIRNMSYETVVQTGCHYEKILSDYYGFAGIVPGREDKKKLC